MSKEKYVVVLCTIMMYGGLGRWSLYVTTPDAISDQEFRSIYPPDLKFQCKIIVAYMLKVIITTFLSSFIFR